jgi:hypothetical protein
LHITAKCGSQTGKNAHLIGSSMMRLHERKDFDPSRPCIEYYRSRGELLLMAAGPSNTRRLALLDTDLLRYQLA